jgi:hypothetical protein
MDEMGRKYNTHGDTRNVHTILIFKVIKARRLRWVGHVARMGERTGVTRFWLGSPKIRDHWKDLGIDGRITLRWTLGR